MLRDYGNNGAVLFIIEGLVTTLPRHHTVVGAKVTRKVESLTDSLLLDGRMVAHLWRIEWDSPYGVELVTFMGRKVAEALERRFEREHIPGTVSFVDDEKTLRGYIDSPHVFAAFHGLPHLDLGPKSHLVEDPDLFDLYDNWM